MSKGIVRVCGACWGSGRDDQGRANKCPTCHGTGVVTEVIEEQTNETR